MNFANIAALAAAVALSSSLVACGTSKESGDAGAAAGTCPSPDSSNFNIVGYSCSSDAPAVNCSSPTVALPAQIDNDCLVYAVDSRAGAPLTCLNGRDAGCCIYVACRCGDNGACVDQ
jgi:hypothetical protein